MSAGAERHNRATTQYRGRLMDSLRTLKLQTVEFASQHTHMARVAPAIFLDLPILQATLPDAAPWIFIQPSIHKGEMEWRS